MRATILIKNKNNVVDLAGEAVAERAKEAGYSEIKRVRIGKVVDIDLEVGDDTGLKQRLGDLCRSFLVHPNSEDFVILEIAKDE